MRAKVVIWVTLGAWVLSGVGCSSIDARTKARDAKLYPGVRNFDAGTDTTSGDMAAGMLMVADFVFSAAADTLLLPFDALYRPRNSPAALTVYSEGTYAGLYHFGFERSEFRFLGGREHWWLTGDIEDVTSRMARPSANQPAELRSPVFLVVEGELSEPGRFGHMGGYRRELRVLKVLETKQIDTRDER